MLTLKPAGPQHSDFFFRCRNDPETIKQSRTPGRVLGPTHDAWYAAKLTSTTTVLFVGIVGTTLVGTGRLDYHADGTELSYVVAPEHRRKGYCTALVAALKVEAVRRDWVPCKADVKPGNVASEKALLRAGFQPVGYVRFEWAP